MDTQQHRPDNRPRGGLDAFDALFVSVPIHEGATAAVRELLCEWVDDHPDADARDLLPVAGVNHCTLFLDDSAPALVWYVDVIDDDAPAWADPAAALYSSPLFSAGLDDLTGEPTVHADGVDGHRLMVNATHPDRQAWYETSVGDPLVAPVAGDDLPIEVVMVALPLRSRAVSWLAARTIDAVGWLQAHTPLGEALREDTDILEAERMYSESFILEPTEGPAVFHYYMETEEMQQLYDAFETSTDWKARIGKWLIRRVFARPEVLLEPPLESDYAVLVHAVDPNRG